MAFEHVYDGTLYTGKPDLSVYGFESIRIVYAWEMYGMTQSEWEAGVIAGTNPGLTQPPLKSKMLQVGGYSDPLICLDYEGLESYEVADTTYRGNIIKYIEMIRQVQCVNTTSTIGFFSVPPIDDWGRMLDDPLEAEIKADNDNLGSLVHQVGCYFPDFYARNSTMAEWTTRATNIVAELTRIGVGKPVYPFVYPYYTTGGAEMSTGNWRTILDFCLNNTDGLVIWGGLAAWPTGANWITETLDFLADNGFYTP